MACLTPPYYQSSLVRNLCQKNHFYGIKAAWRVCLCYVKFPRRAGTKGYGRLRRLAFKLTRLRGSSIRHDIYQTTGISKEGTDHRYTLVSS